MTLLSRPSPHPRHKRVTCPTKSPRNHPNLLKNTSIWGFLSTSPLVHSASEQSWTLTPEVTGIVLIATRNSRSTNSTVAIDGSNPRSFRIVPYDRKNKNQGHSAQEPSTSGGVVGGAEPGGDCAGGCFGSLYCDRRSSCSLSVSVSAGNTDGTKEEGGKLTEPKTSTCRYDHSISSFPLTSTSSGERPERHPAQNRSHSCLCSKGHRWIRSSPSRPRSFLSHLC